MATAKKTDTETTDAVAQADAANAEAQERMDEALSKGYIGSVPDPTPNDAYSIKSGPDSPALVSDDRTRFDQPAAAPGPGSTTKEG